MADATYLVSRDHFEYNAAHPVLRGDFKSDTGQAKYGGYCDAV